MKLLGVRTSKQDQELHDRQNRRKHINLEFEAFARPRWLRLVMVAASPASIEVTIFSAYWLSLFTGYYFVPRHLSAALLRKAIACGLLAMNNEWSRYWPCG